MRLAHLPTPLERCDRLREAVGGPEIWIKRDDCTGLGGGGNKTRKLEFLIGRALHEGAAGVITFGALQSNHARQTAAACARVGLECHLVLTRAVRRDDEHYLTSGNLLLDHVFGAHVHVVNDEDEAFTAFAALHSSAEANGRPLYAIGPGGSDTTGALGYVDASRELADQLRAAGVVPASIVVAASTCGTAAGLILGAGPAGIDAPIDVSCVYKPAAKTTVELEMLIAATASEHGLAVPDRGRWTVSDDQLGDGYGIPTPACLEAIELLARTEGILLDPVYTGKAFAALIDALPRLDGPVVFLHTGGSFGLFAYVPKIAERMSGQELSG